MGAYNLVLHELQPCGQAINFLPAERYPGEDIVEYVADKFGARSSTADARPGEVQRFPLTFRLPKASGSSRKVEIWDGIDRYITWAKDQPQYP